MMNCISNIAISRTSDLSSEHKYCCILRIRAGRARQARHQITHGPLILMHWIAQLFDRPYVRQETLLLFHMTSLYFLLIERPEL